MEMLDGDAVKNVATLARQGVDVQQIEISEDTVRAKPILLIAVPDGEGGVSLQSAKPFLDEWRTAPERTKGTARALTLDSFVALVDRHKSEDTVIFGNLDAAQPSLLSVIDYTTLDHDPTFGQHRVAYGFPISPEWKIWSGADGKTMKQESFALFIEDHVADITSPLDQEVSTFEWLFRTKFAVPSDMMQLARGLEICVEGKFKEIRTLQSGEAEVTFEEVHKTGAGEKLIVPGLFVVNIPLFVGGERERVIVRLRYRKVDGIVWIFQLYRADVVMREALERALIDVGERTSLPCFEGTPEA